MINKIINKKYNFILGSSSPRRMELLKDLGISFDVIHPNIEEKYPKKIRKNKIAEYIAIQKASYLSNQIKCHNVLITADTIVKIKNKILNKPINKNEAKKMLLEISNTEHEVITGVCIYTKKKQISFSVTTKVNFKALDKEEIIFYVNNYNTLDKAGGYGIQEWIGKIGVKSIQGSYTNVMGLPLTELYENLKKIL